ncbi:hypothetical protein NOGI109294_23350 [Nocardiopsis gilva]|nr:hypothetical protein [Nocardiopsis gilva]
MEFRPRTLAAAAALCVAVLSGCNAFGGDDPAGNAAGNSEPSLVEQYKQMRDEATSDFEREVFERAIKKGEIAPEDYEEAFNKYMECAEGAGLDETYTKLPNGIYKLVKWDAGGADDEKANQEHFEKSAECADGTIARIEAMYQQQVGNPEQFDDPRKVAVQCLIEAGIAPADYTEEQFDKDFESAFEDADFDVTDPKAEECLHTAGYSLSVGD